MNVILLCQGILLRSKPEISEPSSIPQVVKEMKASDPETKGKVRPGGEVWLHTLQTSI